MIELMKLWSERDYRYSIRKVLGVWTELSEREIDAIRTWRFTEIESLPAEDRELARLTLRQWAPPAQVRH